MLRGRPLLWTSIDYEFPNRGPFLATLPETAPASSPSGAGRLPPVRCRSESSESALSPPRFGCAALVRPHHARLSCRGTCSREFDHLVLDRRSRSIRSDVSAMSLTVMSETSNRPHDASDNPAKMVCREGNLRVLREAAFLLWEDADRTRLRCNWARTDGRHRLADPRPARTRRSAGARRVCRHRS